MRGENEEETEEEANIDDGSKWVWKKVKIESLIVLDDASELADDVFAGFLKVSKRFRYSCITLELKQ